jgi:hypothetical protein
MSESVLFNKLEKSWQSLCADFAESRFIPRSENDITCYLFYSLVAKQGIPIGNIRTEYRVDGREIDLFFHDGSLNASQSSMLVEIKLRKGKLEYYLDYCNYPNGTLRLFDNKPPKPNDVEKLIKSKRFGSGVATIFFSDAPPSPDYSEKSVDEILGRWKLLACSLEKLRSELKSKGIEILYGPRSELYRANKDQR